MALADYYNKVQAYFLASLGRPASSAELAQYAGALEANNGNVWKAGLVTYIEAQPDFSSDVATVYKNLTGAEPTMAIYNYYTGKMLAGEIKAKGLANAMINDLGLMPKADGTYGAPANWPVNLAADAGATDLTGVQNKITVANTFTSSLDSVAEATSYATAAGKESAKALLAGVTADADTVTTATANVDTTVANIVTDATTTSAVGQTFTLTNNIDTATANVFNSSPVYTPGGNDFINSLQDEDTLTGTGTNPTLNVTLGSVNDAAEAVITPTMNDVQTVNVQVTGSTVQGINFQDSTGLENLNVTRITSNNPTITFNELQASVDNMSLSNSTNTGNVTFAHKEEVLTGTADTLAFGVTNARVNALTLSEGTDGGADAGYYFETINMTSTGTNDLDAVTIQANGREDALNSLAAGTTTQTYNLTAGAAAGATGSFEVNNFTGNGLEFINITANHRVDIAADKLSALRPQNDGITTNDLEVLTITGGANVMIDGLDSRKIDNNATAGIGDDKVLTVNAGTMTGNLKLGVATAADGQISDGTGVTGSTRGDVDLSVTSGSGNDEIATYTNLAGSITTNAGDDRVTILSAAAITAAQATLTTAQATLTTAQANLAANVNPANTVALQTAVNDAQTAVNNAQTALAAAATASASIEGVSRIVTGEGNDTVSAQDLLAFGDNQVALLNSGVDNAAQIDTGDGNDTVTVRNLANATNWDDNNLDDANVDDRFAYVGASVTTGAGTDTLNISGTMAEQTTVDMGTEGDTVNYTVSGLTGAVMADDDDDAREFVSVNSATTAVDASTADLDGAIMDLGTGDDTITFTDSDLAETAVTLVAAAENVANSGAKLRGGDGTDALVVNTTDNLTVVSAATAANTAAITGVETITLNINNAVDQDTTNDTGAAKTDDNDMANTTVTLDVMRVDSSLQSIALNSLEQRLQTLTGSEIFESGDDTTFMLNNMRTGIDLSLSAFEATGVLDAINGAADNTTERQGAKQDDTVLSISTTSANEIVTGAITQTTNRVDVTLNMNYAAEEARGLNDSDSLTVNTTESFDLALNIDQASVIDRVGNAASTTDDDARLIENFTLTFADANAHSVDMMGFGDVGFRATRAPVVTEDVSSTAVTSFTLNSGATAGQRLDIDNVNADTIRVNNAAGTAVTAANVTLRVDASNNYNIVTGSGNDIIDMRLDDVRSDDAATAVNRADFINAGEGRDTMIINGNDDLGNNDNAGVSPSMIINDDVFAGLDSIETILVDTFDTAGQGGANGNLMITIDEQAGTGAGNTNVDTIRMIGNQDNQLDLVIGNNFTISNAVNTTNIAGGALLIDTAGHTAATTLNIESKDDDTDIQLVNMDIRVAGKGGTNLDIIDAGSQSSTVEVRVYTADEADVLTVAEAATALSDGIVNINTGYAGTADTLNKGAFDKLVILEGATSNDDSTNNAVPPTIAAPGSEGKMTITIADRWTNNTTGFTVDASAVLDTDATLATGGATITVQAGDTANLTVSGTQNNDTITTGRGADSIDGNAGNDIIVGDEVVNNNELEVVTFAATYDAGDVITVTHNGQSITATITADGVTGDAVATAIAAYDLAGTDGIVGDKITTAGTPFAGATSAAAAANLRLTGATAGTDYVVTATTNNAGDNTAQVQTLTITETLIDAAETLTVVWNGTSYTVTVTDDGTNSGNKTVDAAALDAAIIAAGGTTNLPVTVSSANGTNAVITITGPNSGVAFPLITQVIPNAVTVSGALALTAGDLGTDQANPTVVTETVARTVIGAADTINGGAGDDVIAGLTGADVLNGGDGIDTLDYSLSLAAVNVNLATNVVSGGDAAGDTISNFESVTGTVYNDTLTGSDAANTLTGGRGDDTINGGAGADVIDAGEGSDSVNGGTGIDTITLTETTSAVDTVSSDAIATANADKVVDFATGTDKFDFNGTLLNGLGTNSDGIAGTDVIADTTFVDALANPNATAGVVFIATTDIADGGSNTQSTALSALSTTTTSANFDALVTQLLAAGGALNGTITNLDSVLTVVDSALLVLDNGADTVVMRVTNTDTTVANTLIASEIQLVGVFDADSLQAADFI